MTQEYIDRAIKLATTNQKSHESWAEYYEKLPEEEAKYREIVGDRAYQLARLTEYDHILDVLKWIKNKS